MKAIFRRLCRLEDRAARPDFQGPSPAEVLFERRRRRSEASGLTFGDRPPEPFLCPHGKSIADVLRNRRTLRLTEAPSRGAELASLDSGSRGFGVGCVSRMKP